VKNRLTGAGEFLCTGGTVQDRYEQLRAWWSAHDDGDMLGLLRMPWGLRLLHFGVLGLLDEDITGEGWFRAGASVPPTAPEVRCTRVLLSLDDGGIRASEAYRCILVLGGTCPSSKMTQEGVA
jgi:hypothetical protein